jgi:uncharacterized protein
MSEAISTESAAVGAPQARRAPRQRWGFWTTCAWGIAIVAVMQAAQLAAFIVVLLAWRRIDPASLPTSNHAAWTNPIIVSAFVLAALPTILLGIALAARLARVRFAEYVALKPVDAAGFRLGLACTIGYMAAVDLFGYLSGRGLTVPYTQELYGSARASGMLVLMMVMVVGAAPIYEELLFRGFLFRGWAASRIGVVGAAILSSLIWAGLHVQYDVVTMGQIFGLGLIFGWLRARTGSTATTIVLHGVASLGALIQAAVLAG